MKILLVDDNSDNLEMLEYLLKGSAFSYKSAKNGKEALELLRAEKFDLIFSDILMPVMDGYQFCKECKQDPELQNIYFAFYTATYVDNKDKEFAYSLGAQKFLIKPQEPQILLNLFKEIKKELDSEIKIPLSKIELEEKEIYKLYNERLINKLEKKSLDLEQDIIRRTKVEDELKKSEERFYLAVEGSRDGLWDWDMITNETYFSEKWKSMLGYDYDDLENHYDTWYNLLHPSDRDLALLILDRHLNGLTHFYEVEFRLKCKDDTYKWVLARGKAVHDTNGKPYRMSGSHTDISEKKQHEIELIKAKEKAEENDRLKSAFLANISHEIRTPMNGILGFATLLKEPNLAFEEQKEYIGLIEQSTARLLNLINDLILISKIESRQMEIHIADVDVNELINEFYNIHKLEVEEKNIELLFKTTLTNDQAIIRTDSEKINAILTHLFKNAIKFCQTGTIEFGYIELSNKLEFFVKDTGIGIPKNKLNVIFDRFVQADLSLSRNYEGAGLGLSIAKAYVEMLGGKIWVESEECKGTQFYFTIPK